MSNSPSPRPPNLNDSRPKQNPMRSHSNLKSQSAPPKGSKSSAEFNSGQVDLTESELAQTQSPLDHGQAALLSSRSRGSGKEADNLASGSAVVGSTNNIQIRPMGTNKIFEDDVVPPTPTPEFEDSRDITPHSALDLPTQYVPLKLEQDLPPTENMGLSEIDDAPSPSSAENEPISPRTPPALPSVLITTPALYGSSSRPTIQAPSPVHDLAFNFVDAPLSEPPTQTNKTPPDNRSYFNPHYTTPPLNVLPPEFQRKKPSRQQRKREKEKDRGELKKEDWAPLGMNKWRALLRANPTWKHVAKSNKSLTTKDWNVSCFLETVNFEFNPPIGCSHRAQAHSYFRSN